MVNRKTLLAGLLAAAVAAGAFAEEPGSGGGFFSDAGGGSMFSLSRGQGGRLPLFWSNIVKGVWGFAGTRHMELSLGITVGRMAQMAQWCVPILTVSPGIFWKLPLDRLSVYPLLGVMLDAVVWTREDCLRSDRVAPENTFRDFSMLMLKAGAGLDRDVCENRFFRIQVMGYYGMRLNGQNPIGGTLRIGFGRRL